jgi:hypothetical protein
VAFFAVLCESGALLRAAAQVRSLSKSRAPLAAPQERHDAEVFTRIRNPYASAVRHNVPLEAGMVIMPRNTRNWDTRYEEIDFSDPDLCVEIDPNSALGRKFSALWEKAQSLDLPHDLE